MKKIILSTLGLVIVMTAHAQTFIPKVGFTLSKVQVEVSQGMKSKVGFTLGVAYNHEISEIFSIQPELNFIQKGFRQDYSDSEDGFSFDVDGRFNVNFLEVPIMAKATFGEENARFYFNAGPSIAIGLGGKYKIDYTISFMGDTESESLDGKIKFGDSDDTTDEELYLDNRLEFGLQVGAGVVLNDRIMIDLRYGHALTTLTDENSDGGEMKTRTFQLTVGYPIRLK